MGVRKDRKEETVQRILHGAAQEFAEIGYEGARVDHIADRSGVNKAMIYYHIGDKQALYIRVLQEVFGDTADRMGAAMALASTAEEKIRAYIRNISQTVRENPFMPRIMIREMASGGLKLPPSVVQDFTTIIGLLGNASAQGRREGVFCKVDPFVLHMMVIGGIGYYRASEGLRRNFAPLMKNLTETDDSDLISEVEKIVLNALRGR